MKGVSEERGKRPAFPGPTKSAGGASVLKHHTQLRTMNKSMPMYLVGRKDPGIEEISNLVGKRVGEDGFKQ